MMSVAGGWFFLMACEMFVLGSKDFRLPGLGSYLQTAASAGDTQAILWGIGTMIACIVLLDQIVWRPVIAWAEKFKMEQVEATERSSLVVPRISLSVRGLVRVAQDACDPPRYPSELRSPSRADRIREARNRATFRQVRRGDDCSSASRVLALVTYGPLGWP